jgi:SSS family solute:Na+ symporter
MLGLPLVDILTIGIYLAAMVSIGFWAMRRIQDQEDYFLAGRRFGKLIQTFAAFGQGTSAESPVVIARMAFTNGAAAIWQHLAWVFAMPVYWFTSVWYRRLRIISMSDFFEERYGSKRMAGFYAIVSVFFFTILVGLGFHAMSKTICAIAVKRTAELSTAEAAEYQSAVELQNLESEDYVTLTLHEQARLRELRQQQPRKVFSHLDSNILIWVVAGVVLIYATAGGLEAAFLTDVIQGIFIILLSIMLLPCAIVRINTVYGSSGLTGAMRTMHEVLPESFFVIWGSPTLPDLTWYYIAALTIMFMINVAIQATQLTACGSAKDEHAARVGFVSGIFLKRLCTLLWGVTGMAAVTLYAGVITDADLVWGHASRDLLGPLNIGLVGLMIACLMAALMSTADCMMITASGLLTHSIYRPLFRNRSESHYVRIGRILGAVVIVGAAVIATKFQNVWQMVKLVLEFNVILAASFWLGMKWRRANRIAAWYSMIATLILFTLGPLLVPLLVPLLRTNEYLLRTTQPEPIARVYTVRRMDVTQRQKEIEHWDALNLAGRATGQRPKALTVGEKLENTYVLPNKSIFWTQGIKVTKDKSLGVGMLNLELLLVDRIGFDLSANSYALNETLRIVIRTAVPFLVFFIVVALTKPDEKKMLDKFFAKTHTPVLANHHMDREEMLLSTENPHRYDHLRLFPDSNWEFEKWDKVDAIGFIVCVLGAAITIALLKLVVSIGT